jgi:hypothetical protein
MSANFFVGLLHDDMLNKNGEIVTTSLTLIDLHDISRSSRTYGVDQVFIVHSSPAIRALAHRLKDHWQIGSGSLYNLNRKEALDYTSIVENLDEMLAKIHSLTNKRIKLIATSARKGEDRLSFAQCRRLLSLDSQYSYLLLFGTGWGMSESLLKRCDYLLEPVIGVGDYNHLSVRSACSIILDRLLSCNRG